MWRFECDYTEGAHPEIMKRLLETNEEQTPGYGEDFYCGQARKKIQDLCGRADADVHFLVGGTQTNATVIRAALRPHQGVLSAESGHINVHETGAIEASGHKVLALPGEYGKLSARQIQEACQAHYTDSSQEHIVQPGMVYLSHPTEIGTLYSLAELQEIRKVCQEWGLWLFLDGARLGYGMAASGSDISFRELAELCDVFYIGGTKVGALFGEAVVIMASALKKDFRYMIKQQGGMLAKGRLLGIQFDTLFTDDLYLKISRHAVQMAEQIRDGFQKLGYSFFCESQTNQQFLILSPAQIEALSEKYSFSIWEEVDQEHIAVRFCTSWATKEEAVEELLADAAAIKTQA
ncbi:threonine aldolase family protein [Hominifimenecus sp. rT4P-3]|uniref:threonine aldolase family protein n=1 Tax=Hominifimenecus sp. rT4P-3 TaxID=3242979 RepID=UPI003DA65DD9